jgi:hypothetical protein
VKDELRMIWKQPFVASFKLLLQHLPGGAEGSHEMGPFEYDHDVRLIFFYFSQACFIRINVLLFMMQVSHGRDRCFAARIIAL